MAQDPRLAILAGGGTLPHVLHMANPDAIRVAFDGVDSGFDAPDITARFETLGSLFDNLHNSGVRQICFAGGMARPRLDPARFDARMMALAPRLMAAMQGGDDALLRLVVEIFEDEGFVVRGAHELIPGLTAKTGLIAGSEPVDGDLADAQRAGAILTALSSVDVGQGAVVAGGLCLGIETLQGTDAMLDFVARTPPRLRPARGVFLKVPKAGQELRVDMPAIGPATVAATARAGLAGIAIAAGKVMILDRPAVEAAVKDAGMFLLALDL